MPELANPKLRPKPIVGKLTPPTDAPPYAELGVASNFSFLRGASHADELVVRAAQLGYRAIGLTDFNSLAGAVRMHVAAKEVGLKFILGTRLSFIGHPDLLVWPRDRQAYGKLCKLLTIGKRRAEKGQCELHIYDFLEQNQGFHAAVIPPQKITDEFSRQLRTLKDALGSSLSVTVACIYEADNTSTMQELQHLSRSHGIPLLATNDVYYHLPQRRMLQDVLTCIRHRCTIQQAGLRLFQNGERYLKSPMQMHALFSDIPQAIRRGLEIAEQCTFNLDELQYEYPHEISPPGQTPLEYLIELTWRQAAKRYPDGIPDKVRALLRKELSLIGEMHFEAYFLTVYDVVRYARSLNILCQGRGSAANSAVCYCLGVTAVDPTKIEVLFERFISSARNEPPDIDIDFEHQRREEVIQYVYHKYGRDRAGMTAEVITYRGRSAVRDVGKALGLGLDTVDQMAKRLDWWDRGTLNDKRIREIGLNPDDPTVKTVIQLSGELLGFPRHLSQHVGGMVMTQGLLSELVPIENASMPDRTVIEWDKQDIDDLKILKVDLLGLGMLSCLARGLRFVNEWKNTSSIAVPSDQIEPDRPRSDPTHLIELHTVPQDDPAVYDMISDADTIGVFQIESRAQMSMLPRLRPKEFYDLVIEVAIVRPGPIQGDMVHPYLRRRQGLEKPDYPTEELKKVLQKTLGVPLFQEHAMQIAIVAAGFTPAEADQLRRAVTGFRRYGAIDDFEQKFMTGMLDHGYKKDFAERCFAQLRGFSTYGFPESHAASFAVLVYVSSWIKRHHPAAFCAALLNSQPMGFYAPAQIVRDAQMHSVPVHPVDINHSDWDCTLEVSTDPSFSLSLYSGGGLGWGSSSCKNQNNTPSDVIPKWNWGSKGPGVRLGLRMIRGLQEKHAQRIVDARKTRGPFRSIEHFAKVTALPSSAIQRLAHADAFGSIAPCRRESLWQAMALHDVPLPLFEQIEEDSEPIQLPPMPVTTEVTTDYNTTGLSLKRHPVALIRNELTKRGILTAEKLNRIPAGRWVKVAGMVLIRQRPGTASGIVFETLEDETGIVNLILMPHIYDQYRPAARYAKLAQADGYVERQGQVIHVKVQRIQDLTRLLSGCQLPSRDFH